MKDRFVGADGKRRLVAVLKNQPMVQGNDALAARLADVAEIMEIDAGDVLIRQDDADTDIYFVLVGRLRVLVHGNEVASRVAGQHVGELPAIDPALRRTASVVASELVVVAKVDEPRFAQIANEYPIMWRVAASEIARRLDERKKFHRKSNDVPVVFLGSSREQLPIAEAVAKAIPAAVGAVKLWSQDFFGASNYTMEDLEAQLTTADFAILIGAGDDRVTSRGKDADAPRDNVIFELGLFMGALGRRRCYLMIPKGIDLKVPSDLLGITLVPYTVIGGDPQDSVKEAVDLLIKDMTKKGAR